MGWFVNGLFCMLHQGEKRDTSSTIYQKRKKRQLRGRDSVMLSQTSTVLPFTKNIYAHNIYNQSKMFLFSETKNI